MHNLASFSILCYKNSVRDKRIVLLFLAGALLILAGFFIGDFLKGESTESVLSPSILASKENLSSTNAAKTEVLITKVLDGDTVETASGEIIRYIGINTPERGESFAQDATSKNQELTLGKTVRLEFDAQTKDRYGRRLAYVFVGETFINLKLLKIGLAVSYTVQPNVKYQDEFIKAEKEARNSCLGLWKKLCN